MDCRTGQVFVVDDEAHLKSVQKALDPEDTGRFAELDHKADPECPRCRGRGSLKSWGTTYPFGVCPRCYPDHPQKAVSFKDRLRRITSNPAGQARPEKGGGA